MALETMFLPILTGKTHLEDNAINWFLQLYVCFSNSLIFHEEN